MEISDYQHQLSGAAFAIARLLERIHLLEARVAALEARNSNGSEK